MYRRLSKSSNEVATPWYDYIIVGAGIASLNTALRILERNPKTRIAILEKYNYIGGRVVTYRHTLESSGQKVQWENGAGRISSRHKLVLGLIKKYNLTTLPIPAIEEFRQVSMGFQPEPANFEGAAALILEATKYLKPSILSNSTLAEIVEGLIGRKKAHAIFDRFPYWAEPNIMRADLAIETLQGVVGREEGFYVCKEGLGRLVECLTEDIKRRFPQTRFFLNTEVTNIVHSEEYNCDIVDCIRPDKASALHSIPPVHLKMSAKRTILALHVEAIRKLPCMSGAPFLKQLAMAPLLRLYAVFPINRGTKSAWFSGIPHTVTPARDNPIRFFIPVDSSRGVVMISYSEGPAAEHWMKMLDEKGQETKELEGRVMSAVRMLFPEIEDIPEPVFFKAHPWWEGCTYWLPGNYSVGEAIEASIHPLPRELPTTYVCGESTSPCQTWMEGALESSEHLLRRLERV